MHQFGPYISLRLYEKFDKNNAEQKDRHRNLYESMSHIMKGIIEERNYYQWRDVYLGYRGNNKESSIIHINLRDMLMNWAKTKTGLIENIHYITNEFWRKMDEIM